jgi:hypothetical protein
VARLMLVGENFVTTAGRRSSSGFVEGAGGSRSVVLLGGVLEKKPI